MKGFLIAAASSNSGKTTITMGLLRALRNRGLRVQPFKCGPDYIDPMFHSMASGNESVNLDTWMSDEEQVRETFRTYSNGADISVVEGVMGLYDGYDKWHGSSGEIAMLLDMPVILVINAKSAAYSVAPLIYGFKNYKIPQPTDPPQPSLQGGSLKDDCSPHCRSEYLSPLPVGRAGVGPHRFIHYGNAIGEALKAAYELGFRKVTLGIMIGKAVKLAEGNLDTHSHKVTMNKEFLRQLAGKDADKIDGITMARELWDIMPQAFFDKIHDECYHHCRSVFPDGTLNVKIIKNE